MKKKQQQQNNNNNHTNTKDLTEGKDTTKQQHEQQQQQQQPHKQTQKTETKVKKQQNKKNKNKNNNNHTTKDQSEGVRHGARRRHWLPLTPGGGARSWHLSTLMVVTQWYLGRHGHPTVGASSVSSLPAQTLPQRVRSATESHVLVSMQALVSDSHGVYTGVTQSPHVHRC